VGQEGFVGGSDFGMANLVQHWRQLRERSVRQVSVSDTVGIRVNELVKLGDASNVQVQPAAAALEMQGGTPLVLTYPDVLLQAGIVVIGDRTHEGQLVHGVSVAWLEIIREVERDPEFLSRIPWRKLEELIAGAYEREGWPEVVLTPRSGDRGRDVIATKPGIGSIRIIDQVKAYAPGHRVSAEDVRALLGVLSAQRNVSKGVITTTASFAPGIYEDEDLAAFVPHRLELKDGRTLQAWLLDIARSGRGVK